MKLNYHLLLAAVVLTAGCSKPASSGNVASNSDPKSASSSTTNTTSAGTTTATTGSGDPATSAAKTTGSTISPPPAASSATGTTAPPQTPKSAPGVSNPGAPPTAPGGAAAVPGGAPGGQQQLTPEQKAMIEKAKKDLTENGAKAEKAQKASLDGVNGVYKAVIDESKIPAQVKSSPSYAAQLAQAKANPPTLTIGKDGTLTIKGLAKQDISGFTSKVDGKPALVVSAPNPQPGLPSKRFVEITVGDSGSTITFKGGPTFKRG